MTRRMQPTPAQLRYLLACQRADRMGLQAATSATATACRCAGWSTREHEITPMGRAALAQSTQQEIEHAI